MAKVSETDDENSRKRHSTSSENVPTKKIKNSFPSNIPIRLLYLNEKSADIHFTFESSDERIPAHKNILALLSPVFNVAFYGSMPEKDEVKIEDACAGSFKQFLQFFYLNEMELTMEHIQSVMNLCHKYQIDVCLEVCSTFLMENLNIEEMCLGYQLAMRYDLNDLKEYCQNQTDINVEEILKTNGFLQCDWIVLNEIVKSSNQKCREIVLLEACTAWARNTCERNGLNANDRENIRNQLKDIIFEIHFKQISLDEFLTYLNQTCGPYNDEEVREIGYIITNGSVTSTKLKRTTRQESIPWDGHENKLLCCRCKSTTRDYEIPDNIATLFSSNKSLLLGEIFVRFKPYDVNFPCVISVERMGVGAMIIETFTKQLMQKNVMYIVLPNPILIEEHTIYQIRFEFTSKNIQMRGCLELNDEVKMRNDTTILFHRAKADFDNVRRGIVSLLFFKENN